MILRHIAKGLVRRDWGTVFVELVLVIAGVFMALQVDNWNNERIARNDEADYLNRLIAELEETRSHNERLIARTREKIQALGRAHLALLDGSLNLDSMAAFESDFEALDFYPKPKTENSVVSEMITSGKVAVIGDPSVRAALTGYKNAIDLMEVNNVGHFEIFLETRGKVHEAVRLRPNQDRTEAIEDSVEELRRNDALRAILSFSREFQSEQLAEIETFHQATVEFHNAIQGYAKAVGSASGV
ncbi:MAG: DUF6090 family protein [Xanthomonadales bacterium]|nr:DUF6090 family protein [Xanthomonadales bacterium]